MTFLETMRCSISFGKYIAFVIFYKSQRVKGDFMQSSIDPL